MKGERGVDQNSGKRQSLKGPARKGNHTGPWPHGSQGAGATTPGLPMVLTPKGRQKTEQSPALGQGPWDVGKLGALESTA